MSTTPRYPAIELRMYCLSALERAGLAHADAAIIAESLSEADLRGMHSHGVLRLGAYVDRLKAGSINPRAELELVHDAGAVVVADAQAGAGIVMAWRAMHLAIERARTYGIGAVSVRNSNHCGRLAFFAAQAPRAGCIGVAASNGDAPDARASVARTHPMAFAVPAHDGPPNVLDLDTSTVAKLFGGVLPGSGPGPEIVPLLERLDVPQGVGHFFLALRVEALEPLQAFMRRVDEALHALRALPTRADADGGRLSGEDALAMERDYRAHGIPLPVDAVAELARTAVTLGMRPPHPIERERWTV